MAPTRRIRRIIFKSWQKGRGKLVLALSLACVESSHPFDEETLE
jgi:hypothetical protein